MRRWFGWQAARKSWKERTNYGNGETFRDHADWMQRASQMLDEDGVAERGVEPWNGVWFAEVARCGIGERRGGVADR
jgi:hypothetical protein